MTRRTRIVVPGLAYHVTQRGSRRGDVFFQDQDRHTYLALLRHYARKYEVEILAYCLMLNHVHHLLIPHRSDSLRWTFQLTHKRYAEYVNAREDWTGHLWQERFYSAPIDYTFFWPTIRYIERNPNEAGIKSHPSSYRWSSAAARCGLRIDPLLSNIPSCQFSKKIGREWHEWLSSPEDAEKVKRIELATHQELPCGSQEFLTRLETEHGVQARPKRLGRPRKVG